MNIFKQFIQSLISPKVIASFRFQKIGKAILYVFFLMLVACIPLATQTAIDLNAHFNTAHTFAKELPPFYVENGILTSELDDPYVSETEEGFTVIIDPTGELTPADISEYDFTFALFERNAVISIGGESNVISYQQMEVAFSSEQLLSMVETVNNLSPLVISFIILGIYLLGTAVTFIVTVLLSLITLLMKSSMASQLSYKQCWILSVYSVTLPTIMMAFFGMLNLLAYIPFSFLLYLIVAVIMITYVLKNIPQPKEPITE
ncbi:DUF1189 domain-containing protein [Salipaludibacillus sp. LMS25]|jgi:maltodextrin utilization protein YvdJ|uniref:DUF1189 domain-containing protein n=1 Tax=Salipaludibacillus sp. LMS25 TaxID=2924031 RepID=UPI0020D18081|nr:DUF1189 domain-containing protein [Salipaludibacillus sp. LMS25]UTR14417.1 DUF1189 domain-containing protein [Salipaludibacillus sp. LMS25]